MLPLEDSLRLTPNKPNKPNKPNIPNLGPDNPILNDSNYSRAPCTIDPFYEEENRVVDWIGACWGMNLLRYS